MRSRGSDGTFQTEAEVGYFGAHVRVNRARGRADNCIFGCTARRYEWANLTGQYQDLLDYAPMCQTCHKRFDVARKSMEPGYTTRSGWPRKIRSNAVGRIPGELPPAEREKIRHVC